MIREGVMEKNMENMVHIIVLFFFRLSYWQDSSF